MGIPAIRNRKPIHDRVVLMYLQGMRRNEIATMCDMHPSRVYQILKDPVSQSMVVEARRRLAITVHERIESRMVDVGEAIMQRSRYAMNKVAEVDGLKVLFSDSRHFKEFPVNFDGTGKRVSEVNQDLLKRGIFGGKDLSAEFPELGQSALYCVTEIHNRGDIDRLVNTLAEVTK